MVLLHHLHPQAAVPAVEQDLVFLHRTAVLVDRTMAEEQLPLIDQVEELHSVFCPSAFSESHPSPSSPAHGSGQFTPIHTAILTISTTKPPQQTRPRMLCVFASNIQTVDAMTMTIRRS